jgi:molybdopterin synthase sulfur carrier subunit
MPTIKVPPVLRQHTGGEGEVSVEGGTVGDALRAFAEKHPATRDQLFSPEGDLNRYVNVYLNDEDVRVLGGLETKAADSDTVVILPAMAGGHGNAASPSDRGRGRRRHQSRRQGAAPNGAAGGR